MLSSTCRCNNGSTSYAAIQISFGYNFTTEGGANCYNLSENNCITNMCADMSDLTGCSKYTKVHCSRR